MFPKMYHQTKCFCPILVISTKFACVVCSNKARFSDFPIPINKYKGGIWFAVCLFLTGQRWNPSKWDSDNSDAFFNNKSTGFISCHKFICLYAIFIVCFDSSWGGVKTVAIFSALNSWAILALGKDTGGNTIQPIIPSWVGLAHLDWFDVSYWARISWGEYCLRKVLQMAPLPSRNPPEVPEWGSQGILRSAMRGNPFLSDPHSQ